ncbi:MAG: hypothetical protein IPK22_21280 [Verrucomicrobiaceae bacterium]|nr:hypothetical protein [Verrucomicrobiaceae bacterium]
MTSAFEFENTRAYSLLLRIEVLLRECLREALEEQDGRKWQRKLPGALLTKIKDSQKDERKPQFNFVRLGPLYYLTFGELLSVLDQKSSSAIVKRLGGEVFLKQFQNLCAPRNAVCHSRPVSSIGLQVIETLYSQLENVLTVEVVQRYLTHPDTGLEKDAAIPLVASILASALTSHERLPAKLETSKTLALAIEQYWWADDSLAGFNRQCVEDAIDLISQYNELPAGVGAVASRQNFCDRQGLKLKIQKAIATLETATL